MQSKNFSRAICAGCGQLVAPGDGIVIQSGRGWSTYHNHHAPGYDANAKALQAIAAPLGPVTSPALRAMKVGDKVFGDLENATTTRNNATRIGKVTNKKFTCKANVENICVERVA